MSGLPLSRPEAMGLDPSRLQRAGGLLQQWIDTDKVPAIGLCVGRRGLMLEPRLVGRQRDNDCVERQAASVCRFQRPAPARLGRASHGEDGRLAPNRSGRFDAAHERVD